MSKKTVQKQTAPMNQKETQKESTQLDNRSIALAAGAIIIGVVMAVISWMILPDMVATQFESMSTGAPDVPKIVAVALPLAITGIFAVQSVKNKESLKICLVGYAANILFWISNM